MIELQQYLPLAVLKHVIVDIRVFICIVATVLTACGIETVAETQSLQAFYVLQQYLLFTVLKLLMLVFGYLISYKVATVLTACGIETRYTG